MNDRTYSHLGSPLIRALDRASARRMKARQRPIHILLAVAAIALLACLAPFAAACLVEHPAAATAAATAALAFGPIGFILAPAEDDKPTGTKAQTEKPGILSRLAASVLGTKATADQPADPKASDPPPSTDPKAADPKANDPKASNTPPPDPKAADPKAAGDDLAAQLTEANGHVLSLTQENDRLRAENATLQEKATKADQLATEVLKLERDKKTTGQAAADLAKSLHISATDLPPSTGPDGKTGKAATGRDRIRAGFAAEAA